MLLSMVECLRTKTAKTVMSMQQRFNVAMSRARDRLYVFHSVTGGDAEAGRSEGEGPGPYAPADGGG